MLAARGYAPDAKDVAWEAILQSGEQHRLQRQQNPRTSQRPGKAGTPERPAWLKGVYDFAEKTVTRSMIEEIAQAATDTRIIICATPPWQAAAGFRHHQIDRTAYMALRYLEYIDACARVTRQGDDWFIVDAE